MTTSSGGQTLKVTIEAVDRASQTIKGIQERITTSLSGLGKQMLIMGGLVSGFAAIAIDAAQRQELAQINLQRVVEATGGSYQLLMDKYGPFIKELADKSKFTVTDITSALATAAGRVGPNIAPGAVAAGAGVASATGVPLEQGVNLIINAIWGQTDALMQLRALGINLQNPANPAQITTDVRIALDPTLEVAITMLDRMKKLMADIELSPIWKSLNATLGPFLTTLGAVIEKVNAWMTLHPQLTAALAAGIATFILFTTVLGTLAVVLGVISAPILLVVAGIAILVTAGVLLIQNWSLIKEAAVLLWKTLQDVFKGGANAIIGFIQQVANDFVGLVNTIIAGINNLISAFNSLTSLIPGFGKAISIPTIPSMSMIPIPRLAEGGLISRPTMLLAGEAGPEAIVPLNRAGGLAGGLAGGIAITINNSGVIGVEDLDQHILQLIRNTQNGGGFRGVFRNGGF